MSKRTSILAVAAALVAAALTPAATAAGATNGPADQASPQAKEVVAYWTPARMAAAQPRDFVLDETGRAYLKTKEGLKPYGSGRGPASPGIQGPELLSPEPMARPGSGSGGGSTGDTAGPVVANRVPTTGATVGTSVNFSATITDGTGVRSATLVITLPTGRTQSFAMTASGSTYSAVLNGFSVGSTYNWHIVARDTVGKSGNATTTPKFPFLIATPSGGTSETTNSRWTTSGGVKNAAGRIYFKMGSSGYVCSGTAVKDTATGKSIIQTAAHCVYDDVAKTFANSVLFIPNQDATTGSQTDTNCLNDPLGCWAPTYGVVDADWTTRTFPNNIPWDYGYYVVPTTGAHSGTSANESLEVAAGTLDVSFNAPTLGLLTHALGYSYSDDPYFMYCAEGVSTSGTANWWLPNCGLSGGASGGPWVQPMSNGTGPLVSVNSWGYTNQPGMAGPKLSGSSAKCIFDAAQGTDLPTAGGVVPIGC